MTPSIINLQLLLNLAPAPAYVTEKLESVQVIRNDNSPSGFQLSFHADRTARLSPDFALLSGMLLQPSTRVTISVTFGGTPTVLIDGFITRQELSHNKEFGASTLTIIGEDVSIAMDRVEFSLEYPEMGDSMIALFVLAKYSMLALPNVIPTATDLIPLAVENVPQQSGTDREYLMQLAAPYGYIFNIQPGSFAGTNTAYWGPKPREGTVNRALSVDVGPATNVESLSFQYDSLSPLLVYGMVQDTLSEEDLPLATLSSTLTPPFATQPALDVFALLQRRNLFCDPRYGYLKAMVDAQAMTDVSTSQVVVGTGELDTLRYGDILNVPGLVDVRGTGDSYDGRYYVQTVTHTIARGSYKQAFTLNREGLGSTISSVTP
jgi:phage protein D